MSPNAIMPFVSYALISDKVSAGRTAAPCPVSDRAAADRDRRRPPGRRAGRRDARGAGLDRPAQAAKRYGLTLADVTNAISSTNTVKAVGRLEDNDLLYLAVSNNAFSSVASRRAMSPCAPARAASFASAISPRSTMGAVPQWLLVDDNGQPAVTFDVYQQDNADSLTPGKRGRRAARRLHEDPAEIDPSLQMVRPDASSSAPRSPRSRRRS